MDVYIIRKLGHVTVYFILTLLVFRAAYYSGARKKRYVYSITFLISLLYAMSDEYHQSTTGFRDGRWSDVLIDSIGISLALLWIHVSWMSFLKKYKRKEREGIRRKGVV